MKTIHRLLLIISAGFATAGSLGGSLFELESKYLGAGLFQYRVKTLPDPLFFVVDITSFGVPFTNRVSYGTNSPLWTNLTSVAHRADWVFDSFNPQGQPYEAVFTARSSETTFRTVTTKVLGYSFLYNDGSAGSEDQSGVGVADFAVLVPCRPSEADNSPTNRVVGFEALPGLKIDKLVMTGRNVNGITFSWTGDFTVRLQATTNLTHWKEVAYLFGSGASTTWTTNQPLNPLGNFFRLQLVGQGHIPRSN